MSSKPAYRDVTVVVPTYKEKDNIGNLLKYIIRNYPGMRAIVADDSPDDSTISAAKSALARLHVKHESSGVTFISRSKLKLPRGLTASVVHGISLAKTKYIIVMDADLQHPPSRIKDIVGKLAEGNQLVVATRASVTNWALYRRLISRFFIYIGYAVLFIRGKTRCGDIFSGYFGVERNLFEQTFAKNKKRFIGPGFKVLFDFLKCIPNGKIKIGEVPYTFHVRKKGRSNASVKQVIALIKSFIS